MARRSFLAALVVGSLALASTSAQAAFDYSVEVTSPTGGTFTDPNFTVTFIPVADADNLAAMDQTLNLAGLTVDVPANASGISTRSISYTLVTTITQPSGSTNTGTIPISGVLNVTAGRSEGLPFANVQNSFTTSFPAPPAPLLIGGIPFQFTAGQFAAPTVNTPGSGAISVSLQTIPEPGSLALVGLGAATLFGLGMRRRSHRAVA